MGAVKLSGLILVSGLGGALLVSVLAHFYFALTSPSMLGDGQYGMIFMLTFPVGWLIGGALYGMTVFSHPVNERPAHASWIFAVEYIIGLIAMPIAPLLIMNFLFRLFVPK